MKVDMSSICLHYHSTSSQCMLHADVCMQRTFFHLRSDLFCFHKSSKFDNWLIVMLGGTSRLLCETQKTSDKKSQEFSQISLLGRFPSSISRIAFFITHSTPSQKYFTMLFAMELMSVILWTPHKFAAAATVGEFLDQWPHHGNTDFCKRPKEFDGNTITHMAQTKGW